MDKKERNNWLKSYETGKPPHWALSLEPSKLALVFAKVLKKNHIEREKVLEIGCGNGRDSFFLAEKGYAVTGLDLSSGALALARRNLKILSDLRGSITFKKGEAEKLPFPNDFFGGVYSIGVLHSTNLSKSFREINRTLKENGVAVIHLWQRTVFSNGKKEQVLCQPKKLKLVLNKLPFRILEFKQEITTGKIDQDKRTGPHQHYAVIVKLKKKPRS